MGAGLGFPGAASIGLGDNIAWRQVDRANLGPHIGGGMLYKLVSISNPSGEQKNIYKL